ncbi:MAG: holin [Clostridiaceae bacterium]|jgi:phi LC3 family holin|nr:holin [Clostridiaceae bacterium]
MNINLKSRLTNKTFWVSIVSAIVLLTQQLGYNIFPSNWSDILNTILTIFILLGIIVDTSTPGMNDVAKQPIETNTEVKTSSDNSIDSATSNTVQAQIDTSANAKIEVANPDNVQVIGQEVTHVSAASPNAN